LPSALFQPFASRGLELPDRLVVSPMCQYAAQDGSATDWHLMHLGQFAMGAAGLIIAEATHVSRAGRISHNCLGLYSDENEIRLARVVGFCRRYGVAKLGVQLAHAGRKGSTRVPLAGGGPLPADEDPWRTLAPSAIPYAPGWHTPRALDDGGIARVKAQFVEAAGRALRIGFDMIELHMAHGYLVHQFLSPLSNRRTDGYGGSRDNRMRLPLELFAAVREVWPAERPMWVRVSATDWVEGGWDIDDTVALARELKALGCDAIDVSSGGLHPAQRLQLGPGYQVGFAERVRREAGIPTVAVGMITGARQAEAIVAEGRADLVALARGVMDDPRWAWHAARELGAETAYSPMYARCKPGVWKPVHEE
jgi:2,4-dienoyl-CoA reductase-like NADH-dependent reductase (Old Yellow Enzyme family)